MDKLFLCNMKKKNILLSAHIPIKYLPEVTKFLSSLIAPCIKKGGFYDAGKFFARPCENESSQIKGIYFDQSYIPVTHADSFRINIDIASIHILTARILDVSNAFQNTNFPIHERFLSVHLSIILNGLKDRIQMLL